MTCRSVHIALLLCHHKCKNKKNKKNCILPWGLRYPDLLPVPINLPSVTADWCDLSLSVFIRREMLWVPWRRCAVSWPTTWAPTPSGDGRGCLRESLRPGEKAELISREGVSDLGSEGICCLTFLRTTCCCFLHLSLQPFPFCFVLTLLSSQGSHSYEKCGNRLIFVILFKY